MLIKHIVIIILLYSRESATATRTLGTGGSRKVRKFYPRATRKLHFDGRTVQNGIFGMSDRDYAVSRRGTRIST